MIFFQNSWVKFALFFDAIRDNMVYGRELGENSLLFFDTFSKPALEKYLCTSSKSISRNTFRNRNISNAQSCGPLTIKHIC